MATYWIWWIGGLLAGISLTVLAVGWIRSRFYYPPYKQEVDKIFQHYWNRKPEDELYAWYKVRRYLNSKNADANRLEYVKECIKKCDRDKICGKTVVTIDGEWEDEAAETMDRV